MPRKSNQIDIIFIIPKEEEGIKVLAEAMGEVHTKIVKEILNKIEGSKKDKDYVYSRVQKILRK